jgi:hypothetical protein
MTPDQFIAALAEFKLGTGEAAKALGVDRRTIQRWASGDRACHPVLIRLFAAWRQHPDLIGGAHA